jgi:hypothetical protein
MLGPRVNKNVSASSAEDLFDRIAGRGRVMVLDNEAHHVHDENLAWNQTTERLRSARRERGSDDPGAGVYPAPRPGAGGHPVSAAVLTAGNTL